MPWLSTPVKFSKGKYRKYLVSLTKIFKKCCTIHTTFFFNLGNEKGLFEMHDQMADLYLVKEIDRESLKSPILTLHIQVSSFSMNFY